MHAQTLISRYLFCLHSITQQFLRLTFAWQKHKRTRIEISENASLLLYYRRIIKYPVRKTRPVSCRLLKAFLATLEFFQKLRNALTIVKKPHPNNGRVVSDSSISYMLRA